MLIQACPYYTMFPIDFPLEHLKNARPGEWVLDPFCGRGTTLYAARLLGLPASGVDISPVAAAIADAMLAEASPEQVVEACRQALSSRLGPAEVPEGEFWELAYHRETLEEICFLRESLIRDAGTDAFRLLRLILLGRLHGPLRKTAPSYLSNQMPRTFAPKPGYAVRFWKKEGLCSPPRVSVLDVVARKVLQYLEGLPPRVEGWVALGDSREFDFLELGGPYSWVVTSPPYFRMRTYVPDQWLRHWFLGGPPQVHYSYGGQIGTRSVEGFVQELRRVWVNVARACVPGARLVVRFGVLPSSVVKCTAEDLLRETLIGTPWRVKGVRPAGTASCGRRQALQFFSDGAAIPAMGEADMIARLEE
ncbi:DNA methyltransferase [Moorellaceae bacterium AZ2]